MSTNPFMPHRRPPWGFALLLFITCFGCSREGELPANRVNDPPSASADGKELAPRSSAQFVDNTDRAGIRFSYRNGEEAGHFAILESMGGGVGMLDYDLDGKLDLFFPGGGGYTGNREIRGRSPAMFRNEGHWKFAEVTGPAGLTDAPYYSHGVAVGDFDNDGFPDVLVTGYGGLLLYHNCGDGTFQEGAASAGLDDKLWSISAAWGDVNGDGHLDLYVTHYVDWSFAKHPVCRVPQPGGRDVCSPRFFDSLPDALYLGNGDGTFRDVSAEAGLVQKPGHQGKGIGVVMADLDLDGDLDIYVCNDTVPNFLYRNDGHARFQEIALISGTALGENGLPDGSMGVAVGDFNLDGLPDLWVANYENESFALYRNEGNCSFQHVSQSSGVAALGGLSVGWGTVFFDFDRDGDEDLFAANGHVIRFPQNSPRLQPPLLLENHQGRRFNDIAPTAGRYFSAKHMGRGVAVGDVDNDGDQDLVVVHTNEPVVLLSNETKNDHDWLSVRLIGTKSSRDPIGATLFLETTSGRLMRQLIGGGSYASTNDRRVFFGLGKAKIKTLEVRWPSGTIRRIDGLAPNRFHTIIEPNTKGATN
jgi:enediyne biosynthesis protein E4